MTDFETTYPDMSKAMPEFVKLYPDEQFNGELERRADVVREWIKAAKGEDETPATLVIEGEKQAQFVSLQEVPASTKAKQLLFETTGFRVYRDLPEEPHVAWWLSPAWLKKAKVEDLDAAMATAPSESSDRIDTVVLTGMVQDGRSGVAYVEVMRDENGKLTGESSEPHIMPYERNSKNHNADSILSAFWSGIQIARAAKELQENPDEENLFGVIPRIFCEALVAKVSKQAFDLGMEVHSIDMEGPR
jgi:hypothetical protein